MARGAARSPLLWLPLVLGSFEATSALRMKNAGEPLAQPSYFFMAHHKTGTALANHMCDHLKKALTKSTVPCARCQHIINTTAEGGHWCWHIWSDGHTKTKWPEFYDGSHHFFGGTPLDDVVKKGGQNWKALHVIRDPLTTFASAFIYDQKGNDHTGAGKKELEHLSLPDGLRLKAKDTVKLMAEIQKAHELAMSDKRVIELRFEDFKNDYDHTTGRLFDFMTDGGHRLAFGFDDRRQTFQAYAAKDDQKRWSKNKLNQTHVSDPSQEEKVVSEVRKLCAAGDEHITTLLKVRNTMGYGVPCPGPDEQ